MAKNTRDYYEILGVAKDASKDEIKKSFRRRAMKCHPDRNSSADAEAEFKELQEAYAVLSDDNKRANYDQFGNAQGAFGGKGFEFRTSFDGSFSDVFDNIFREFGDMFGGAAGPRQASKGRDKELSLDITLEEIATGTNKSVRLPIVRQCGDCDGTGRNTHHETTICPACGGSGKTKVNRGSFLLHRTCPSCHGEGYTTRTPCKGCKGSGYAHQIQQLSVTIPAGVEQNDLIRLSGKGDAGRNGGPSGDLYIRINQIPHPFFRRKGNDLYCDIPISVFKAALGAKVEIPTLSGSAELEIPPETQNGDIITVRTEGIKAYNAKKKGDLKCRINVETPVNLSPKQAELLRELQVSMDENPSEHYPKSGGGWLDKVKGFFD